MSMNHSPDGGVLTSQHYLDLWRTPELSSRSVQIWADAFLLAAVQLGVELLVEVGAHEAWASRAICARGKRAIAIEANPAVARHYSMNLPACVRYINCAVGSSCGEQTLYIPDSSRLLPTTSSLRERSSTRGRLDGCTVACHTLDCILRMDQEDACTSSLPGGFPDFVPRIALWIDVEGSLRDVMSGAERLLQSESVVAIYAELEDEAVWEGQWTTQEAISLFATAGLVVWGSDCQTSGQRNFVFLRETDFEAVVGIRARALQGCDGLVKQSESLRFRAWRALYPLRNRLRLRSRMRTLLAKY